ncbi:hypothetical protein G7045_10680 [Acidovorax sp. HDW3]|uniref:hypothetical protein n=1 Tax=Acidovorax sp. HDW3 TaxID=2714923 RepID=UPI001407DB01|nr:hypothetical protein [Acidovorax sp. HDW3]QIL44689.1 hypothetical protein G7045_10680 [Acidovorax sp. HDW3]
MLTLPLLSFTVAAALGLYLASHILRGRFPPWSLSPVHAFLGLVGLALLLTPMLEGWTPTRLLVGAGLLSTAALVLAVFHLRKKMPPKGLVLLHASTAVSGFLTLLSQVFI